MPLDPAFKALVRRVRAEERKRAVSDPDLRGLRAELWRASAEALVDGGLSGKEAQVAEQALWLSVHGAITQFRASLAGIGDDGAGGQGGSGGRGGDDGAPRTPAPDAAGDLIRAAYLAFLAAAHERYGRLYGRFGARGGPTPAIKSRFLLRMGDLSRYHSTEAARASERGTRRRGHAPPAPPLAAAAAHASAALAANPASGEALCQLALAAALRERALGAAALYSRALVADEPAARAWHNLRALAEVRGAGGVAGPSASGRGGGGAARARGAGDAGAPERAAEIEGACEELVLGHALARSRGGREDREGGESGGGGAAGGLEAWSRRLAALLEPWDGPGGRTYPDASGRARGPPPGPLTAAAVALACLSAGTPREPLAPLQAAWALLAALSAALAAEARGALADDDLRPGIAPWGEGEGAAAAVREASGAARGWRKRSRARADPRVGDGRAGACPSGTSRAAYLRTLLEPTTVLLRLLAGSEAGGAPHAPPGAPGPFAATQRVQFGDRGEGSPDPRVPPAADGTGAPPSPPADSLMSRSARASLAALLAADPETWVGEGGGREPNVPTVGGISIVGALTRGSRVLSALLGAGDSGGGRGTAGAPDPPRPPRQPDPPDPPLPWRLCRAAIVGLAVTSSGRASGSRPPTLREVRSMLLHDAGAA